MKNLILEKNSKSIEDTIKIASDFISSLENKNCIIILSGNLGAGKTHFTKGIFKGVDYENFNQVTSPTFDLVNSFKIDNLVLHHFDLYRIDKLNIEDELWLNELLNENSLCIIEWGDKFNLKINKKIYQVIIEIKGEYERNIKIFAN
jgi:tRNA threonylcarbamoyladenosine biosynthesis protein TsaE